MTPGLLCLPMEPGRQASRPRLVKAPGPRRLFTAPSRKVGLLCTVFFFLGIAACSAGQGRLEIDTDAGPVGSSDTAVVAASVTPSPSNDTPEGLVGPGTPAREHEAGKAGESGVRVLRAAKAGMPVREGPPRPAVTPVPAEPDAVETAEPGEKTASAGDPGAEERVATQHEPEQRAWEERGIREEAGPGYTRVVFRDVVGQDGYRYSLLEDPPRLVLDVLNPRRRPDFDRMALQGQAFQRVRVGRYPQKVRFVLDFRQEGMPEPLVRRAGTDVEVVAGLVPMGGPEVPVAVAKAEWKPVRVTGVEFKQGEASSEVVVSTDGPVAFDVKEQDNTIVVTLPGAEIPERLRRPLDTHAFPSAIIAVKPEQVGSGPEGKVRVLIQLREKRPYNVLEEEKGIRVSVLLPEKPPEIALLPPPPLPEEEGLAVAREKPPEKVPPMEEEKEEAKKEEKKKPVKPPAAPAPEVSKPKKPVPKPVARKVAVPRRIPKKRYSGRKVSLDFKDADIQNVLRLIAEVSGQNIVISEAVKGKVTIRLKNVPWDMALDVILKTYALDKEKLGPNIIRVAPFSQLKREREEALKASQALERVEDLQTRVVPVNYAKAEELQSLLGRLKSKRPDATILVDSRTNALIIKDLASNIKNMVRLVRDLDTPTPQVLIEAKIVELDVDFERELGIQWGTLYQAGPATGNPTGLNFPHTASVGGVVDNISGKAVPGIANPMVNLPAAVDDSAGGALGISLASITNSFQLDLQLSALEKRNHARILSSPRIATLNNQEARIEQGQEVPYQTTSDEGTKTEFKDAKLRLSVTPQITFDRSIIMNIVVTNDTPIRDPTVGFIIGKKEAKTTVLVKDGDTAVIGGIYTNNKAESLGGVPWFMDLPVAGYLFKKKGNTEKRTELVIFITPRIIPPRGAFAPPGK